MTASSAPDPVAIPASHLDLLTRPGCAVFTTIGTDGWPQSSLVGVDFDGSCPRINTTLESYKGRNLPAKSKVSLLVVDPHDTNRYLQVQGDAELITDGAVDDAPTDEHTHHSAHCGLIGRERQGVSEIPVVVRIRVRRITVDAIYSGGTGEAGPDDGELEPSGAPWMAP